MASTQIVKYEGTTVPAEQSAGEIAGLLRKYQVREFSQMYDGQGRLTAIRFSLQLGEDEAVRMPVLIAPKTEVIEKLFRHHGRLSDPVRRQEQAERIAWRHVRDLTEQLLLAVKLGLKDLPSVFMSDIEVYNEQTGGTERMGEWFARQVHRIGPGQSGAPLRLPSGR